MKDELGFDDAVREAPAFEKCEWAPLPFHCADAFVGARPAAPMVAPALTRTDQEIFRLELLHVLDCQRRGNLRTKREARAQVHERSSLALEELASPLDLLICGLPGESQLKAAPDQAVFIRLRQGILWTRLAWLRTGLRRSPTLPGFAARGAPPSEARAKSRRLLLHEIVVEQ